MDEILTAEQVANLLQVHPFTVLKFIKKGKLKASKLGRMYRIRRSDVDAFLDNQLEQPQAADKKKEKPKKTTSKRKATTKKQSSLKKQKSTADDPKQFIGKLKADQQVEPPAEKVPPVQPEEPKQEIKQEQEEKIARNPSRANNLDHYQIELKP